MPFHKYEGDSLGSKEKQMNYESYTQFMQSAACGYAGSFRIALNAADCGEERGFSIKND